VVRNPDFAWLASTGGLTSSCDLKSCCCKDGILYPRTREVVSPERPNLILSTNIPNIETCVLVRDGLNVEADGGNGVDFACGAGRELEGVEDSFKKVLSAVDSNRFALRFHRETSATRDMRLAVRTCPLFGLQRGREQTYWSFRRHQDQASTGAFPCCRRSWPGSGRVRRPWLRVLLWCVVVVAIML
jgi:hypothetical protein